MTHQFVNTEDDIRIRNVVLYQSANNLAGKDNLSDLPEGPAVYAICGRVNGKPSNARYVGATENLQQAIHAHFSATAPDSCLKFFMLSIKIKELVYLPLSAANATELEALKVEWEKRFKPECNEKLNKIY